MAIAKIALVMQTGMIPPNLHYNTPNPGIPALRDGRLKVVTEPTVFSGGYIALNSFGMGGSNVHCLFKSASRDDKPVETLQEERLITCSGRMPDGISHQISLLTEHPTDINLQTFIQESSNIPATMYPYRGYFVTNGQQIQKSKV